MNSGTPPPLLRRLWCPPAFAILLLPVFLFPAPQQTASGAASFSEYQLKAAFLLNFTKFVEWPAAAFESPTAPVTICILGDDPFNGALDQAVAGESVNGRSIAVLRIRRVPSPRTCQLLFLSSSENPRLLADVGPGVLTVGETDTFLRDGGMIAFVLENRRVRFSINSRAAAKASLVLSSRLLNVAKTVVH